MRSPILTPFMKSARTTRRRSRLSAEPLERRLALAVTTPFTVRYTTNDTGDITFAANTLMTAGPPATPQQIADVQNGVGTKLNNNDFTMTYVDIDADPSTFNSSASNLVMPAGSEVLFAGLYWGARTNNSFPTGLTSQRNTVKFMAPGDGAYRNLTGTTIGTTDSSYQSFADVTSIVQAAESGTYTTANVQSITNAADYYAGWSLVVAYRAPGAPARNLTIFDGYGKVANSTGDKTIDISISGFKAPTSGPVNATLGFIAYEGDRGSDGDKVLFDGGLGPKQLSDASNPANNFFNSTISNRGSLVPTKNPNYVNQMGYDADLVTANGVIKNGATSAKITLTTGGETYYPGVVTSAIELFAPEITVAKQVADLNGGTVQAGDVLRYTITVANDPTALDAAVNVLLDDAIPAYTTYKPGSLVITAGANTGAKTDAADADQAEVVGGGVRFQLGTGAGGAGTSGGRLAAGASSTVTFEVTVDAGIPAETLIENTAALGFTGETSGFNLNATGFADIAGPTAADLAVTKTDGKTQYVPGTTSTYTIVVTNNGPADVIGAQVTDIMPSNFANPTWTATYSAGSSGPASGSGSIDVLVNLLNGGTATFTVTAPIRAEATGNITNVVTVTPPADVPDPTPGNNTALDTDTFLASAALAVTKSVSDLNGGFVVAGDLLRYTIVVSNTAASPAEAAANVALADLIPANTTYAGNLTFTQGSLTGSQATGVTGNLGTLAQGASATVTFDVTVNAGIAPSTVITNTANASGTGAVSGLPLEGSASVGIATPTAADLTIVKTGPATFTPGAPFTYEIVVTNKGPSAVTGATVSDTFPTGITNATWTATYTGSGSSGPASGSGDIAALVNLADGGTATFQVTVSPDATINALTTLTNRATVTPPTGVPDPNPADNESTTTAISSPVTDLAVTKTDGRATYVAGAPVTYTIVVTNNGPSFARQASVIDTLDPTVIDVAAATWTAVFSGTGSAGNASGSGSIGEIIDLASGGTATYTITAPTLTTATKNLVNTVTVATSNLSNDPNPSDNSATDTDTVVLAPALAVAKSVVDVNGGFVVAGDTLRYTIVVSNTAGSLPREAAANVALADLIPANTTYAGNLTFSQGSLTGSQATGVSGNLGTLAAGASATVTFDVTVNAGIAPSTVITNTASANGTGAQSGLPVSASDQVGIATPPASDLAIVKTAPATYVPGSPLSYTIVVSNAGPTASTAAQIADAIPAGVTSFSWTAVTAGGASVAAPSGTGAIATTADLPVGGTVTFTVTAQTDPARTTDITNTATVTPTDGHPDPNPGDQTSTATSTPVVTTDLSITKTDGATTYVPGTSVTYTITVTNAGPSTATAARVQDTLPAIITTASWTAAITAGTGTIPNASGTGSIDEFIDLGPGATAVYTVTAITSSAATTSLVNTATVTGADGSSDSATDTNTPVFNSRIVLGTDMGCESTPLVRVLDPADGSLLTQFYAYEPGFRGGVHVYGYDVTGDGIDEIITAPGPGRPGEVRVWDRGGTQLPQYSLFPFGPGYRGGVEVAAGSITGLGTSQLVAGQQRGGLARVFPIESGGIATTPVRQVRPFGAGYRGGLSVATADIGTFSGTSLTSAAPDGITELVIGSGPGIRATVKAYNGVPVTPAVVNTVKPISPTYARGVSVARLPGATGSAEGILVSAGSRGGSRVETYRGTSKVPAAAFAAYGGAAARADVFTAALSETEIYSVQGQFGTAPAVKRPGVVKNTAPSGGTQTTLSGSTAYAPPLRISVLRR
jgi:uncharacterized repeat protein (TIGR01451 family)/fimbrial isopeptide formation D2 family protein